MKRTVLMSAGLHFFLLISIAQADWTPTKRLTWNSGDSLFPEIAADSSGNPHLVWTDASPGNYEVFYTNSTDGGAIWPANRRLTWNSGSSGSPAIAVEPSGKLHLVWADEAPGHSEIYCRNSPDGGTTWTASRRLTWTLGSAGGPAIGLDSSGNLHLFWLAYIAGAEEIYYKKSADSGATWSTEKRLTWTSAPLVWGHAFAMDSSGDVYLTWCKFVDPSHSAIYFKKSTDGGSTWTPGEKLIWTSANSRRPSIAVDGNGHLHVVCRENTPGNWEIYYKKSTDGGTTWSAGRRLTWTSGDSVDPDIVMDSSGDVHVVWSCLESGAGGFIAYKKSTDGGATWTSAQRLTWVLGLPSLPVIAADSSDNLHLGFYSYIGDDAEVFYKKHIK